MELRQLRYFAAVAAHGSFSRAAGSLHLTQPAVSRQVQNLEEELGLALLHRTSNTVALTAAGELFYEEARDLLGRADRAVRRVRARTGGDALRVGYVASLVAGILPRAIERLQALAPQVRLELFDLTPQANVDWAASGKLDVVVLPQGLEGALPQFQWIELHRLAPLLIMPRRHPLARRRAIHPARLREVPLHDMGRANHPEYAVRLRAILKPFGVRPRLVSPPADSVATLFAAVEAGGGLAVLNEGISATLPAALVSRPFSPPLAPLAIVAGLPAVRPNGQAETFARLLHEEGLQPLPMPSLVRRRSHVRKAARRA